jgi:hypothetical protein
MKRMHAALAFGAIVATLELIVAALVLASKGGAKARPIELVTTRPQPLDTTRAPALEVQTKPVFGTGGPLLSSHPPAQTAARLPRPMKRVISYECAACGTKGAADKTCCRECYASRALAANRAAPFDSAAYGAEEVLCPGCDEITNRPATSDCTVNTDGKFKCDSSFVCHAEPVVTYADLVAHA